VRDVELNFYGQVATTDVAYWDKCRALLLHLPDNIKVQDRGSLNHSDVPQLLHDHHVFVLPRKGENCCHAAVESFVNGTPVILNDKTPWANLSEMLAGLEISLNDRAQWLATLQQCVGMGHQAYAAYVRGASEYARRFSKEEAVGQHRTMFVGASGQSL
jgi:glycosyltransferase involved in cell wall biosynthesis